MEGCRSSLLLTTLSSVDSSYDELQGVRRDLKEAGLIIQKMKECFSTVCSVDLHTSLRCFTFTLWQNELNCSYVMILN